MAYLQISDIKDSVKHPSLIIDDFIRKATFEVRPNGEPRMYSGGFTSVFPCRVQGEKWAFRCWHTDLGNVRDRFQKLQSALTTVTLPYLADFKYVDEGIIINGKIYPTTRMRWIDGLGIKDYIYTFRDEPNKLENLAKTFLSMCKTMHENGFAHGDLQHGNIIVGNDGKLYLIDYDSLYHTSMGDMADIITGLKDYQHPGRGKNVKATEKLDYFSELIIYTCIMAVAADSTLADTYNLQNGESMLFTFQDYMDVEHSTLINTLRQKNKYLDTLCNILIEYLSHSDINELLPVEQMLDIMYGLPEIKSMAFNMEEAYEGDEVILQWEANNVLNQKINNRDINVSDREYCFVADIGNTYFKLSISNYREEVSAGAIIKVHPLVRINFDSDTHLIRKRKDNRIRLTWNVENASKVEVKDGMGEVLSTKISGQKSIKLTDSAKFVLTAFGKDRCRIFTKELSIDAANEGEIKFHADKHFTLPGVPVVLSWNVTNATSVKLEGDFPGTGRVSAQGQLSIEPTTDTKATLKIKDAFGSRREEIEIKMLPLPAVKLKASVPAITNEIALKASFVRPKVQIITPNVSSLRGVPFVPQLKLKMESPMLNMQIPSFAALNVKPSNKGLASWKNMITLTNNLLSKLKDSLLQYGNNK